MARRCLPFLRVMGVVCMMSFCIVVHGQVLRLSPVLQSKMVVQQNKPFAIWGWTTPGALVSVRCDWQPAVITTDADEQGGFLVYVGVPAVRAGDYTLHSMSVSGGGASATLDSLLFGEVWFLSGQSNMQFGMREVIDSAAELAKADDPHLRLFNTALNFSATPLDTVRGSWEICTPGTVRMFSAVGYYMGRMLREQLNVPVGLVFSGIGASAAQGYVPQSVLAADTQLNRVYLAPYLASERSREVVDAGFSFEKVTRPFLLYNALIHPFRHLSIRGICWYQGEANRHERASYTRLTQAMVSSWREMFGQGELPFYYVQIAPFFYDKEDPTLADEAFFREAQERISLMGNTAMVVTMDVGEAKNLHPKNKKPIGMRLARTALNRIYGRLDMPYEGPRYRNILVQAKKVLVYFEAASLAGGLRTNDGKAPAFFEVAGEDRIFHPAVAVIEEGHVTLTCDVVKRPVAVRYAFTNYPVTNLENTEGIPAVPFRTDDWEEAKP